MLGGVTFSARHAHMFALQQIPGELVVERLRVPLDERKILAVVFGVALRALIARPWRNVVGGVQSLVRRQSSGNFGVTLESFQRSRRAKLVTGSAVGGAGQRLMGPRKRAGRNLRGSRRQVQQQNEECRYNSMQRRAERAPAIFANGCFAASRWMARHGQSEA